MSINAIDGMINEIVENCLPWIRNVDGNLVFVDPIDGEEISAHYGATHMAAALIIHGDRENKKTIYDIGFELLKSIMERWDTSKNLPAFHNDFNNFALCVIWKYMNEHHPDETVCAEIQNCVLTTADSNNPTVNWFPMRWYVNLIRFEWTGEQQYLDVCAKCEKWIQEATYADGFIDDRIPKGMSFNLQYDVATVAVMQFLNRLGVKLGLRKELGALLKAVAPDGDINYLGRGTNQVFAWGLWIYLLASAGKDKELDVANRYLSKHLSLMLKNHNMMLNDYPGEEKYLWWDYHYCSVYTAHLLFWLVLAKEDAGKYPIAEEFGFVSDSGIHVYKAVDYFAVIFDGRREYLAEKGPAVSAVWTKSNGMIYKGSFGPWQGAFGNKYANRATVIANHLGLYETRQNNDPQRNKLIHRLFPNYTTKDSLTVVPLLPRIEFEQDEENIYIDMCVNNAECVFSFPASKAGVSIKLYVDGHETEIASCMAIRNQYQWVHLYQSRAAKGQKWRLSIRR